VLAHAFQLANIYKIQEGDEDSIYGFERLQLGEYLDNGVTISLSAVFLYYYNLEHRYIHINGYVSTSASQYGFQRNSSIDPNYSNPPTVKINDQEFEATFITGHNLNYDLYIEDIVFDQIYEKISLSITLDIDIYEIEHYQDNYTILNKLVELDPVIYKTTLYQVNKTLIVYIFLILIVAFTYLLYRFHATQMNHEMPNLREEVIIRYLFIPYSIITAFAILTFDGYHIFTSMLIFWLLPIITEFFVSGYLSKPIKLEGLDPEVPSEPAIRVNQTLFNKTMTKIVVFTLIILTLNLMKFDQMGSRSIW
jgi:hypothetical protein